MKRTTLQKVNTISKITPSVTQKVSIWIDATAIVIYKRKSVLSQHTAHFSLVLFTSKEMQYIPLSSKNKCESHVFHIRFTFFKSSHLPNYRLIPFNFLSHIKSLVPNVLRCAIKTNVIVEFKKKCDSHI